MAGAAIAAVNTTYGTPAATGAVSFGNVIGVDVVNANTATIVSPLLSSSNNLRAGNYAQTVTGLAAGGDATNYSFGTFTTASNNYQVNQLALTGSVTAGNKVYDANTTASITGRNLAGAVAGDGVSYTGGTATFSDKNVGNGKTVTATGLSLAGADAGNYTVNTSATTTANVTPATLNVTYTGVNKVYDASATAAVNTADNHLGADVITINRTANFADANAGVGKTINVTGVTLSGADAGNYTVASTGTANADITPRGIIVTANNATKVYGGADPAFTFNVGGAGFAGADTITSVFTGALARVAGENVASGPYAINQGTLASNANYSITAYTSGQFSITPKALTIAADNKSKLVSDPLPPFTATYAGFAFADTPASLTGALAFATPATATSPAGAYVITPSGQSSSNYTITFVSGALTVTGAPTVPVWVSSAPPRPIPTATRAGGCRRSSTFRRRAAPANPPRYVFGTAYDNGWPAKCARTSCSNLSLRPSRTSRVEVPMCGASTTLSMRINSGGTRGSSANTSSAAPAICWLTSALTSAGSSTMAPREMLTRKPSAPSAARIRVSIRWRVAGVNAQATTRQSALRTMASRLSKYGYVTSSLRRGPK